VATVSTGETLLSIQQRVEDAGFDTVEVIPMGGDRAFLHCRDNGNILQVFIDAADFFGLFLTDVHRCTSKEVRYERGAWVRIYGTPVHAWNTNFFKLCVSKCGRFVRADECTLDRGRIDFARILISTYSLEVLNKMMVLMVDGCNYNNKLVEKWGCNLGEDAFLTEEVVEYRVQNIDEGQGILGGHGLDEVDSDVEDLINDIHREWREHENNELHKQKGNVDGSKIIEQPVQDDINGEAGFMGSTAEFCGF
jgi:hypothetical protein